MIIIFPVIITVYYQVISSRKTKGIVRVHLGKNLSKKLFIVIFNLRIYIEKLDIIIYFFLFFYLQVCNKMILIFLR